MKRPWEVAWLGAVVMACGLLACSGDDESDGEGASISGVIPGDVFVGRDVNVLIVGSDTAWGEGVTVDMGEGITVNDITVASPTALMVHITTSPEAALGPRDVSVDGLQFAAGFELVSPLKTIVQGNFAQGSVTVIRVQNLDFNNPFDTTAVGDGVFDPFEYINIEASVGRDTFTDVSLVEPYVIEMVVLTDVLAEVGPRTLEILSGPFDQETSYRFTGAFDLLERQPIPLTSGEPVDGTINQRYESLLYSITPSDMSIVQASSSADLPIASPNFAFLPASGKFSQLISFSTNISLVTDEVHYLVYWDNTGSVAYPFQVSVDSNAIAASVLEVEPNNSRGQAALVDAMPAVVEGSALGFLEDQDWVRFDLTAEDLGEGKIIHALTYGQDRQTDTVLTLFRGNTMLAESSDSVYLDDVYSDEVTQPGAYYVRVTASTLYTEDHDQYGIGILLEDP